jgi:hypothetical protein
MKTIVLLIAILLVLFGLTGVLWPEGVTQVAKYSVNSTGLYVVAAVRTILGALLFIGARATRMPKTLRVIGILIFLAGVSMLFMSVQRVQAIVDALLAHGAEFFRVAACLPLIAGLVIGGAALTKPAGR